MSIPVGSGVDGPNYSSFYNSSDVNQMNAAAANVRTILQLVQNTDIIFITNIGGKLATYNAQPNTPTLMPLVQLRQSPDAATSDSEQQVSAKFQGMVATLPDTLRQQLEADMNLPADQRDPKLVAFEAVLTNMAEQSVWATNLNAANVGAPSAPTSAATARLVQGASNGVQVLDNVQKKAQAEYETMPEIDPSRVVYGEYLQMLSTLIGAAKQCFESIQVADANREKNFAIAQQQIAMEKLADQLAEFQKAAAAKAKQATMDLVMKITGPIIAVLALAATVLSGGTLAALAVAVITTCISIADSATNFMSSGIKSMLSALPPAWQIAVTVILVVLMVVVLRKVSGVGSSLAKQATKEAADQAVDNAAKAVSLQAGMMVLSASGVITTAADGIAQACCSNSDEASQLSMILQMMMMLVLALMSGKYMGNINTDKVSMLADIASDSLSAGTKAYSAVVGVKIGILTKEQYDIQAALTQFEATLEIMGISKQQIEQSLKDIQDLSKLWSDFFLNVVQSEQQITTALARAAHMG